MLFLPHTVHKKTEESFDFTVLISSVTVYFKFLCKADTGIAGTLSH